MSLSLVRWSAGFGSVVAMLAAGSLVLNGNATRADESMLRAEGAVAVTPERLDFLRGRRPPPPTQLNCVTGPGGGRAPSA
jgi:hypothetical protein